MAADHFGGFVFVAAAVVAQTQHTDIDFWWVCREEEREQSRKRWWDPGPLSLARTRAELPQTEERKRESRAGSDGGTQGRSLSRTLIACPSPTFTMCTTVLSFVIFFVKKWCYWELFGNIREHKTYQGRWRGKT
jgi:hypothetical protein